MNNKGKKSTVGNQYVDYQLFYKPLLLNKVTSQKS